MKAKMDEMDEIWLFIEEIWAKIAVGTLIYC